MSEEKAEYQKVKLGALWINTDKNGKQYYSGKLEANIQMWPNKKREGKNDPDFVIYASEKKIANQSKLGTIDFGKEDFILPKNDDLADIPF